MVLDRSGKQVSESASQASFLQFLYRRPVGRALLRLLRARWISRLVGAYMDSPLSAGRAKRAIRDWNIDLSQYEQTSFRSYNAFFTRKRKATIPALCSETDAFLSPADARLTVVPLQEGTAFPVKQAPYTVGELLGNNAEAVRFTGGYAFVFRLSVEDYHRYAYPDDGRELSHWFLQGTLHTVNPIALERLPVFHRNCREVTLLECTHCGVLAFVEVGAMLVGRIVNHHREAFSRGEEKGYFAFGGSTVVILTTPNSVLPDEDLLQNSLSGIETYVHSGEQVGKITGLENR